MVDIVAIVLIEHADRSPLIVIDRWLTNAIIVLRFGGDHRLRVLLPRDAVIGKSHSNRIIGSVVGSESDVIHGVRKGFTITQRIGKGAPDYLWIAGIHGIPRAWSFSQHRQWSIVGTSR